MFIKKLHSLPVLAAALWLMTVDPSSAQTFKTLHHFIGSDGASPNGGLTLANNTLYGTAWLGGAGKGTVFSVNTDGTGFRVLYRFSGGVDGADPVGNLTLLGNTLYGVTQIGGSLGANGGTVFAVNTDGSGFRTLHSFPPIDCSGCPNSDGASPTGGLILLSNTLYGTASYGGDSGEGTVFSLGTDGTGFSTLYSFTGGSDGASPRASLSSWDGTLYGAAFGGGDSGSGSIFSVHPDGTEFMNLYSFAATSGLGTTNNDGANPWASLFAFANGLCGTTSSGGRYGNGTVFKANIDGTGFTTLHNFFGNNSDGSNPIAALVLSNTTLYGTTRSGGTGGSGIVFVMPADGTGFTTLHNFIGSDGANPWAGLILSENVLYGTTKNGGNYGNGTVFSISLTAMSQPVLTINPGGTNVVLSWATNLSGFILQSSTSLFPPFWTTNLPAPVVINGNYTVTNPVSGSQQFFRLSQ